MKQIISQDKTRFLISVFFWHSVFGPTQNLCHRYVEFHMPAHVVLHDDLRRSDQATSDAEELISCHWDETGGFQVDFWGV